MLTLVMTQSLSGDVAICYVLLVLWMKSCFHIMEPVGQNQRQCYVSLNLPGVGTGGKVHVYCCWLIFDCE